jgi:hypothetical protein
LLGGPLDAINMTAVEIIRHGGYRVGKRRLNICFGRYAEGEKEGTIVSGDRFFRSGVR